MERELVHTASKSYQGERAKLCDSQLVDGEIKKNDTEHRKAETHHLATVRQGHFCSLWSR